MPVDWCWPRVSIVTPSFNQGRFIEETIRAILLQGYPNLEYIISEDASTDDTMDVVRKYEPWLEVIVARSNGGMSKAVNRAWAQATGDIITWISSDDVYLPGALQRVAIAYRENPNVGAVVGAFRFMGVDSTLTSEAIPPRLPQSSPVDLTLQDPASWRLHQVATFYTEHALQAVGFQVNEDLRHNMDREILYRVCRSFPIKLINEALACFRTHAHSKSWSISNMINMGEEYSRIQAMFYSADPNENRRRDGIAAFLKAKGYLKYSKYTPDRVEGRKALLKAVRLHPRIAIGRSFFEALLNITGFSRSVRR